MAVIASELHPWYLDVFWRHFEGRGFLPNEGVTSTGIPVAISQDATTIAVDDATGFLVGESIVVGVGQNWQAFTVEQVVGNTLTVAPKVKTGGFAAGIGVLVNHSFGNNTHPVSAMGYAAYAQTLADTKQRSVLGGTNRLGTTVGTLDTTYTDARAAANVPTGWESLGTAAFTATSYSTADGQPQARAGGGTQIQAGAIGDGMRTLAPILVTPGEPLVASAMAKHVAGTGFQFQVVDQANPSTVIAQLAQIMGDRTNFNYRSLSQPITLAFTVPAGVTAIELRFVSTGTTDQMVADDVRLLSDRQLTTDDRYVFEDPGSQPIAWLGDSWGVGGAATSFQAALQARLNRTITLVNASVTGNTLTQMLARFETDVVPHQPRYCVIEYGANDLTEGLSQAEMESDADNAILLCQQAGIIPVFAGLPAIQSVLSTAAARNDQIRARVDRASGKSVTINGSRQQGDRVMIDATVDGVHETVAYSKADLDRLGAGAATVIAAEIAAAVAAAPPITPAGWVPLTGALSETSVAGVTVNWIIPQPGWLLVGATVDTVNQQVRFDPAALFALPTTAAQREFLARQLKQANTILQTGTVVATGTGRV